MANGQKSQLTWNLKLLFSGDNDPKMARKRKILERENYKFINKWKNRDDYLKDPKVLKEALDELERLESQYSTGGAEEYYFWLRTQQDQNNPQLKARNDKIAEFSRKLYNDRQFFTLRLAKIPPNLQKKFLKSPLLKNYYHFLENLFKWSKYQLSEAEEKIINLKDPIAHTNWVRMTSGFLSRETRQVLTEEGRKEEKSFEEIIDLLSSKKKKVRDIAAQAFNEILKKNIDVAEAELNSVLANKKVNDELRKMPRPDLGRHLADDISSEVVDSLVAAVASKVEVAQRYYRLKSKLLGLPKLAYHERNVPFGNLDQKYTFEQANKLATNVFRKISPTFTQIFTKFLQDGQFDVYPRKGKHGGAFCVAELKFHPTYILLNFTSKLEDVLTLAHEMGHGIHNELMRGKQNALNFGTPLSTAEVASVFMEDFILEGVSQQANNNLKLALMVERLNRAVSTIFRQTAAYRFETELHKTFRAKGYLSKDEIGQLFQKHMASYMGPGVEQSPGSEN
ncbi:MAG: M3 family oligoendopeptidase, partial [bacterium]|nr:M3 family oligoendopeptidase [bacterium]